MEKIQPFETQQHDLTGYAAVDMDNKTDFNILAQQLIPHYDPDRFEPIALRFFVQKKKPIVTFYVLDKFRQERASSPKDKLPTRKFKINMSFEEFIAHVRSFDLTVTNNAFDMKDMVMVNK